MLLLTCLVNHSCSHFFLSPQQIKTSAAETMGAVLTFASTRDPPIAVAAHLDMLFILIKGRVIQVNTTIKSLKIYIRTCALSAKFTVSSD